MTEQQTSTQETLRDDILGMGLDDYVSMADVLACIANGASADALAPYKQLVVDTVRSLLVDGLAVVGDIPGRDDPGFKPWPGSVDEVMSRFITLFVDRYEDRIEWEYRIWINLTDAGERVATEARQKRQ